MKKSIIALTIAALALSVTPAFAEDQDSGHRGKNLFEAFNKIGKKIERALPESQFMVHGTVVSVGTSSLVVNAQNSVHANLSGNQATIVVNSDTKFTGNKHETMTLANIVAGNKVMIHGQVTGTTLTASRVHVQKDAEKKRVVGTVTAKTDDSLTITNSLTGTSQTVALDSDTRVKINGETKTAADISVGDSGWIKLKVKAEAMVAKLVNLFR